jgi:hypothetical protein
MGPDDATRDWLLDSDPALRWQVERDVIGAPEARWRATRERVATEGFGARLLGLQDPDGQWAGGSYFPAGFDFSGPEAAEDAGQPYTATTWALNDLREWGVDAAVLGDTAERLAANSRWDYNDLPYWAGEVDACINAYTLANGAWLGVDVRRLAAWFVEHRLPDGGWNCEWVNGSTRSSFHSTVNAIRGLLEYEQRTGGTPELTAARHAGEEYLLERHLLRRRSTGEWVAPWAAHLAYPFRWYYSALKALDHFRSASLHEGTAPDPRLAEAVALLEADRDPDGRWRQERRHPGRVWFEVDVPPGEQSRWLTFFALRVLDWWHGARAGSA